MIEKIKSKIERVKKGIELFEDMRDKSDIKTVKTAYTMVIIDSQLHLSDLEELLDLALQEKNVIL